ncbi:MAG: hypothetical protein RDU14_16215 [Melioribacteraceae bacterium]|nr:hypothetical protein [Melioribacteraceae bacterium]
MNCTKESSEPTSPDSNNPPKIISFSVTPANIFVGESTDIVITAEDPDDDPIIFEWSKPSKGFLVDIYEGSARYVAASAGDIILTCKIKDSKGAETVKNLTIVVKSLDTTAPIFTSLSTAKQTIGVGEWAVITANAYHPKGTYIYYIWSTSSSGFLEPRTNTANFIANVKGEAVITCTAKDLDGNQSLKTISLNVIETDNKPPVIQSLTSSADTIKVSNTATITCTAFDPNGDPLTYTWQLVASVADMLTTPEKNVITIKPRTVGTITIKVTVYDLQYYAAVKYITIFVRS